MIKDDDGSLNLAEALELLFDGLLEFALLYLLLCVAVWVWEAIFPCRGFVREGDVGAVVAAATLPLILRDVDRDAIEIGGDEGLAAEAGQGAVEADEDVLGEVVDVLATAGEAQEGAEDHGLMVAYQLLEGEVGVQAGLDNRVLRKFHGCE